MPLPKCSPKEVYDKKSKKCIVIGSDAYKSIVKNNPSAFKHYASKIAKATKVQPTCSAVQVYNKHTKRCVAIGSQAYREALKKDPTVFNDQKNKISMFLGPKVPKSVKKMNLVPPESPNETLANIMKKMKTPSPPKKMKTPSPPKKMKTPESPNVTLANITKKMKTPSPPKKMKTPTKKKKTANEKKLLTPVPEKRIISEKTKKLFMFKVAKFLRTIKNTKAEEAIKGMNSTNSKAIPRHILTTQRRMVSVAFPLYLSTREKLDASSFNKKIKKTRRIETLTIHTDNFHDKVYRYALKSFTNPNIIDLKWFKEMTEYYKKLAISELYTIWAYTYRGDVYLNLWERGLKIDYDSIDMSVFLFEIINLLGMPGYTRDIFAPHLLVKSFDTTYTKFTKMTPNDIYQFRMVLTITPSRRYKVSFIKELISRMSLRLSSIIRKAPATKETMVVYRGVTDSFFTADDFRKKPNVNEVFVNKGFVSSSLDPKIARSFSEGECCFKVITILPGTKCLPLYGLSQFNEHEILFNKNTKYVIRDKYMAHIPVGDQYSYWNSIHTQEMKMTDIVVG